MSDYRLLGACDSVLFQLKTCLSFCLYRHLLSESAAHLGNLCCPRCRLLGLNECFFFSFLGRFERQPGAIYEVGTTRRAKIYHNIFNVDDCEVKCTQETRFRCMMSVYRHGTCHLWSILPNNNKKVTRYDLHIDGAQTSVLKGIYDYFNMMEHSLLQ